jgi:hypothetical protein
LEKDRLMNWYKTAKRMSLAELLHSIESNPRVDRSTFAWLQTLEDREMGPAINMLTKNPTATIEEIKSTFTKVVPLTTEQERLVIAYPLIGEWMRGIMERLPEKKRETAFNTLREKAAGIRDWIDRTGERLQGRTLENAVSETEKWHSESISLENGEYLPTKKEDIIISYQNSYTWQRISSGTDAKIEGQKTQTCVGNYCDDVEQGKIDIYSLRDENNSPLVTAGFKHAGAVVVEMKGAENADPSETLKNYISDILKELGTVYNDGERYLSNNYNLKNFEDLNIDDIEKSPLLRKIINNQIAREGYTPPFAKDWVKKMLESGAAPKEWEAAISRNIAETGFPPNFAKDWVKEVLDSGAAPKEWEEAISRRILTYGYPPDFAQDWVKKMLDSGTAPKEWEEAISRRIITYGYPPDFTQDWVKKMLDSGAAPKEWEAGIIRRILAYGYPPDFAQDWAKKILDSGTAPKEWEAAISRRMLTYGSTPVWAQDWAKKMLDSGTAPKEWEAMINRNITVEGFPPNFAKDWAKKILDSGTAPKEWEARISRRILTYGYPLDFAKDWAKEVLDSGAAPKEWEAMINRHITVEGYPPNFAKDWAKKMLDSGAAPKEWEEAISRYITAEGEAPVWAQDWAKKQ